MNNYPVRFTTLLCGLMTITILPLSTMPVLARSASPVGASQQLLLQEAQAFSQKGAEYLAIGQADLALKSWRQAHRFYTQAGDPAGIIGTQINQAQALQALGFYRQSLVALQVVNTSLQKQPDSVVKVQGLLSLGNALRALRLLEKKAEPTAPRPALGAKETLRQALALANELHDPESAAQIKLSLGNTLQLLGPEQLPTAAKMYRELATTAQPLLRIQAQLNLYRLEAAAETAAQTVDFITKVRKDLDPLTPSRSTIYAYLNLAETIKKNQADSLTTDRNLLMQVSQLFTTAIAQAQAIKDQRSSTQAIGYLANLYELNAQYDIAQNLTQQALVSAENLPAPDLAYRLHWQLGRILTASRTNQKEAAIAAYQQSINHLQSLRNDLSALDADVQFSFRNSVEPVYRELVGLLLKDGEKAPVSSLAAARDLIEALQVAELQSFLHQGCIDSDANTKTVPIDQIDRSAAVIYPIILPDRVAVIAAIPNQPLRYYSQQKIAAGTVESIVNKLRVRVERAEFTPPQEQAFHQQSKQIYDLIMAPLAADLQRNHTKTLVFVLDGVLRNMPMSALYDGNQYLVEKYNLALTPGLRLLPPQGAKAHGQLRVFSGGITAARQGFMPLPGVQPEIESIGKLIPNQPLVNADFNSQLVSNNLETNNSQIVHLATHGQFSSKAEETFLLTWDNRIDLNQLNNLLQNRGSRSDRAINLLVLSACQTASGDDRATLGLAGVAVRAGARSTIASLWSVSDEATQLLMSNLYQNLVTANLDKAESLRIAQQSLLHSPKYRSPFYWAPFVLVGNWR
jgi:CHAT domain-containing protein